MGRSIIIVCLLLVIPAIPQSAFAFQSPCTSALIKALEDQAAKYSHDSLSPEIDHTFGNAEVEWSGIRDRIEAAAKANGIGDYKNLTASIYRNGVEVEKGIPWDQTSINLPEPPNGQIHYYVVYKNGDDIADISNWRMRETDDMKTLAPGSFTGKSPGEHFSVQLNDDLKSHGMSEQLTKTAVRLGNEKVVWSLSDKASDDVRKFVSNATDGVDVKAEIGRDGLPEKVTMTDRRTGRSIPVPPDAIKMKGDAAFSDHKFFWDDMWVAGGSVEHNPQLARSTIESWLDVQDKNGGGIPREVLKSNDKSLWFEKAVRFPGGPKANLTYTNPYLINWAADKLYRYNPSPENLALLKRVSSSVERYVAWMEDPKNGRVIRDKDGDIIGFNGSALGSGLDNSRLNVGNANELAGHKRGFVDFLSQQIAMLKDDAQWQLEFARAAKSGVEKRAYVAKSRALKKKADEYAKILNDKYWDPNKKFYYDIHPDSSGEYVQDHTTTPVSGFWPLFANAADRAKVNQMVEAQMVPNRFGSTMPSNALDTIDWKRPIEYTPKRDAAGNIVDHGYHDADARWNPNATMGATGFSRSGRPDTAFLISRDFTAGMAESSPNTVEEAYGLKKFVQPDGTVVYKWVPIEHGPHTHRPDFAGWGKVPPIDGVVRDVIGLHPSARRGLQWNLRTPLKIGSSTDVLGVQNLQYMGGNVEKLVVRRISKNVYEVTVKSEKPFDLRLGSLLDDNDHLASSMQSIGKSVHVAGGDQTQIFQIAMQPFN